MPPFPLSYRAGCSAVALHPAYRYYERGYQVFQWIDSHTGVFIKNSGIIIGLSLIVLFVGVFDRDLWTPDEPRVAAMSLEMARTGNYVVPHLSGRPFVEKPPLYYAVGGGMIRLFGDVLGVPGAVRFSTVLWGIGVLVITFKLTRRIVNPMLALSTVAILATMAGFVENFHWIRVDAALAFFCIAAVWSFIEAREKKSLFRHLITGVFTAGAFLSKGWIGPILIAIPVAAYLLSGRICGADSDSNSKSWVSGAVALFTFAVLSIAWIVMFRLRVSDAVWHEWFWVNHVGRFTGEAVQKGHIHSGDFLYYLKTIAVYSLPWTPFVFAWIASTIYRWIKTRSTPPRMHLFLLIWGVASAALLTLPATKRDVYLLPVIPAYAFMSALFLSEHCREWMRGYSFFINGLCLISLMIFASAPWVIKPFLEHLDPELHQPLTELGVRNIACFAAAAISAGTLLLLYRRKVSLLTAVFVPAAMLFAGAFTVPMKAIDYQKSLRDDFIRFTKQIPPQDLPFVAGWNFSQTTLGAFYVYSNLVLPQIESADRVQSIIAGRDPEYCSLVLNQVHSIDDLVDQKYLLLYETYPRGNRKYRALYWIRGPHRCMLEPAIASQSEDAIKTAVVRRLHLMDDGTD